ncbi:hypothetical protein HPB52_025059 [Rhipicephalus sanguineus]|uniref:Peptidase M20 domain-containing protein 2 n=1 Tax=Rhipicephalus sanguineus TaxID=34632 RepID=A0A9D4TCB6_RHISA|nr:hypothetical protein HPB52_024388 [Rhipicephalus sanguineus]KAH7986316.1 hypothetical protein HPB52_025059 [Rhipicephalus sanguineus]
MAAADFSLMVNKMVEDHSKELWELSRFLFENPELALEEVKAHDKLCEFLEQKGFTVQREYCLETAFRAEFDAPAGSDGPCVALLCEYDALPEIGHGCGHNLIAEASVGAALAVQEAMKTSKDIRGRLVVLGTPGEEGKGGKQLLIDQGALEGIDVAIMSHPSPADIVTPLFSASQALEVCFKGKPAHAAAYPWEGVNALDAAIASFVNIGLLRQQCKPSSWIQGVITEGGRYASIIPEKTDLQFCVRSDSNSELLSLRDRVEACFRGAAEATGCAVSIRREAFYMDVIQNGAIAASYRKHGHSLGKARHHLVGSGHVRGAANHTREFATLAGSEEAQPPTLRTAKVLALTVLDLLTNAELMRKARAEFDALQLQTDAQIETMTR